MPINSRLEDTTSNSWLPGTITFTNSDPYRPEPDPPLDTSIFRNDFPGQGKQQTVQDTRIHPCAPLSLSGVGSHPDAKLYFPLVRDPVPLPFRIASEHRCAALLSDILTDLDPLIVQRSLKCHVRLVRASPLTKFWAFSVDCGHGPKIVKLKAVPRKKNSVTLAKMDVYFSCTCEAWRWQGPEYHAKSDSYLKGSPRGTASVPVVRDPGMNHFVCKHVLAVITRMKQHQTITKGKPNADV